MSSTALATGAGANNVLAWWAVRRRTSAPVTLISVA
jgi:hypothetical protein